MGNQMPYGEEDTQRLHQKGQVIYVRKLKRIQIRKLRLRIRRSLETRTPRPGQEARVTFLLKAPKTKRPTSQGFCLKVVGLWKQKRSYGDDLYHERMVAFSASPPSFFAVVVCRVSFLQV